MTLLWLIMPSITQDNTLLGALDALFYAPFSSANDVDAFWISKISRTKNGQLLKDNIFNRSISKNNTDIFLVSAIDGNNSELASRNSLTMTGGIGCLGNVTYCVQSYIHTGNTYNLHNFGTVVMRHRRDSNMVPILFKVNTSHSRIGKMSYLGVGKLIDYIYSHTDILDEQHLSDSYDQFYTHTKDLCEEHINNLVHRYNKLQYVDSPELAREIINQTAKLSDSFTFLSYFYFESVSLALMLNSEDILSAQLAGQGEYNHLPYIEAVHRYKQNRIGKKFESYGFTPNVDELLGIVRSLIEDSLVATGENELILSIVNNLIFFVGTSITDDKSLDGLIFHDFCNTDVVREELKPKLDYFSSYYKDEYMKLKDFDLVINSTIEKGEIGICPGIDQSSYASYVCRYTNSSQGVEIVKEIEVHLKMIEEYHAG